MRTKIIDIPNLNLPGTRIWKVKALVIDGKSPALEALKAWSTEEKKDYKKIMKAIAYAAQVKQAREEKKVKKTANTAHGKVYEFRADKMHARLMFFYDETDGNLIICTNEYWKGKKNQTTAFATCAKLKRLYEKERDR